MNGLSNYQPKMSATEQREMSARLNRIIQLASSAEVALEVSKSVQEQGWLTYIAAVNQAKLLLDASQQGYPDENSEIAFQHWRDNLGANISQIYRLLFTQLVQVLESIPTKPSQTGFFEELGNLILQFLTDVSPPSDSFINQMRQLEMGAKRALTATAEAHTQIFSASGLFEEAYNDHQQKR